MRSTERLSASPSTQRRPIGAGFSSLAASAPATARHPAAERRTGDDDDLDDDEKGSRRQRRSKPRRFLDIALRTRRSSNGASGGFRKSGDLDSGVSLDNSVDYSHDGEGIAAPKSSASNAPTSWREVKRHRYTHVTRPGEKTSVGTLGYGDFESTSTSVRTPSIPSNSTRSPLDRILIDDEPAKTRKKKKGASCGCGFKRALSCVRRNEGKKKPKRLDRDKENEDHRRSSSENRAKSRIEPDERVEIVTETIFGRPSPVATDGGTPELELAVPPVASLLCTRFSSVEDEETIFPVDGRLVYSPPQSKDAMLTNRSTADSDFPTPTSSVTSGPVESVTYITESSRSFVGGPDENSVKTLVERSAKGSRIVNGRVKVFSFGDVKDGAVFRHFRHEFGRRSCREGCYAEVEVRHAHLLDDYEEDDDVRLPNVPRLRSKSGHSLASDGTDTSAGEETSSGGTKLRWSSRSEDFSGDENFAETKVGETRDDGMIPPAPETTSSPGIVCARNGDQFLLLLGPNDSVEIKKKEDFYPSRASSLSATATGFRPLTDSTADSSFADLMNDSGFCDVSETPSPAKPPRRDTHRRMRRDCPISCGLKNCVAGEPDWLRDKDGSVEWPRVGKGRGKEEKSDSPTNDGASESKPNGAKEPVNIERLVTKDWNGKVKDVISDDGAHSNGNFPYGVDSSNSFDLIPNNPPFKKDSGEPNVTNTYDNEDKHDTRATQNEKCKYKEESVPRHLDVVIARNQNSENKFSQKTDTVNYSSLMQEIKKQDDVQSPSRIKQPENNKEKYFSGPHVTKQKPKSFQTSGEIEEPDSLKESNLNETLCIYHENDDITKIPANDSISCDTGYRSMINQDSLQNSLQKDQSKINSSRKSQVMSKNCNDDQLKGNKDDMSENHYPKNTHFGHNNIIDQIIETDKEVEKEQQNFQTDRKKSNNELRNNEQNNCCIGIKATENNVNNNRKPLKDTESNSQENLKDINNKFEYLNSLSEFALNKVNEANAIKLLDKNASLVKNIEDPLNKEKKTKIEEVNDEKNEDCNEHKYKNSIVYIEKNVENPDFSPSDIGSSINDTENEFCDNEKAYFDVREKNGDKHYQQDGENIDGKYNHKDGEQVNLPNTDVINIANKDSNGNKVDQKDISNKQDKLKPRNEIKKENIDNNDKINTDKESNEISHVDDIKTIKYNDDCGNEKFLETKNNVSNQKRNTDVTLASYDNTTDDTCNDIVEIVFTNDIEKDNSEVNCSINADQDEIKAGSQFDKTNNEYIEKENHNHYKHYTDDTDNDLTDFNDKNKNDNEIIPNDNCNNSDTGEIKKKFEDPNSADQNISKAGRVGKNTENDNKEDVNEINQLKKPYDENIINPGKDLIVLEFDVKSEVDASKGDNYLDHKDDNKLNGSDDINDQIDDEGTINTGNNENQVENKKNKDHDKNLKVEVSSKYVTDVTDNEGHHVEEINHLKNPNDRILINPDKVDSRKEKNCPNHKNNNKPIVAQVTDKGIINNVNQGNNENKADYQENNVEDKDKKVDVSKKTKEINDIDNEINHVDELNHQKIQNDKDRYDPDKNDITKGDDINVEKDVRKEENFLDKSDHRKLDDNYDIVDPIDNEEIKIYDDKIDIKDAKMDHNDNIENKVYDPKDKETKNDDKFRNPNNEDNNNPSNKTSSTDDNNCEVVNPNDSIITSDDINDEGIKTDEKSIPNDINVGIKPNERSFPNNINEGIKPYMPSFTDDVGIKPNEQSIPNNINEDIKPNDINDLGIKPHKPSILYDVNDEGMKPDVRSITYDIKDEGIKPNERSVLDNENEVLNPSKQSIPMDLNDEGMKPNERSIPDNVNDGIKPNEQYIPDNINHKGIKPNKGSVPDNINEGIKPNKQSIPDNLNGEVINPNDDINDEEIKPNEGSIPDDINEGIKPNEQDIPNDINDEGIKPNEGSIPDNINDEGIKHKELSIPDDINEGIKPNKRYNPNDINGEVIKPNDRYIPDDINNEGIKPNKGSVPDNINEGVKPNERYLPDGIKDERIKTNEESLPDVINERIHPHKQYNPDDINDEGIKPYKQSIPHDINYEGIKPNEQYIPDNINDEGIKPYEGSIPDDINKGINHNKRYIPDNINDEGIKLNEGSNPNDIDDDRIKPNEGYNPDDINDEGIKPHERSVPDDDLVIFRFLRRQLPDLRKEAARNKTPLRWPVNAVHGEPASAAEGASDGEA